MLKHTIEEVTLKNGSKGLLIDIPSASVMSFRVNFRAGDAYTSSIEKIETAHIMEHLSLGANKKFPRARDFQAELEKNGASSNASTGTTDMIYEAECADFEWERVAELFLEGISRPLFLDSEFEAECGNVYEELVGRGNNQGNRLYFEMAKKYGLRVKTMHDRADLMKNVTLDDIKEHYKRTHFAENMCFIVAGQMQGRKTRLKTLLSEMTLPKANGVAERFEMPKEMPKSFVEPLFIENDTIPNSYFYIDTYRQGELDNSQLYALGLLETILTDTLYSKIFGEAREKGLLYYLSSGYYRTAGHSSWWFGSQISEKQLSPFLDIFVTHISDVLSGNISDEELEGAKMYQIGGHQRSAQTVGAVVNGYSGLYFYNGKVDDYYTKFPAKVQKITKQQLVDVARAMFEQGIWGVGFLGTISESARSKAHQKLSGLWATNWK